MQNRYKIILIVVLGLAFLATSHVTVPTVHAQGKPNSACNSLQIAEGEADGWMVPDNVFRFQLLRPSPSSFRTRQQASDGGQIQQLLAKVSGCYYIRSVTVTTKSEVKNETIQYRDLPVTEVWNDSLILVLERKR